MRAAGIIAEYNPFHNGHAYQIAQTRAAGYDHIAVAMSPDAVQRGEPSIFSKWARTEAALACGADLVVELPAPWALASAEGFAMGGVFLLDALGCVEALSFGSESGDLAVLESCAAACLAVEPGLPAQLKGAAVSYAAARETAVAAMVGAEAASALSRPNDTLGVEYLKAIARLGSPMGAFTVQRAGAGHHSAALDGETASAGAIRALMAREGFAAAKGYLPPAARGIFRAAYLSQGLALMLNLEAAAVYRLRTMGVEDFARLPDVNGGLERRFFRETRHPAALSELLERVRTRRYPLSRIRRAVYSALLGLTREDAAGRPPCIRVLGFNERGKAMLKAAKLRGKLPVCHSLAKLARDFPRLAEIETLCSDLFLLAGASKRSIR
ncbi:MAG: nucleotidyltransferase family protein [Oscillospiraceae bacterium]|jgi:predicted nucleotidyltransferase|nr:nucleotidyltransferase family protein [Oscillospiraceae bacterium]